MTSPVEIDYRDFTGNQDWTMSFLYRNKDLGPVGEGGDSIKVQDRPEITVLSIGISGDYGMDTTKKGVDQLLSTLEKQDVWEINGEPRSFNYNGPYVKVKWNEVQIPIKLRSI